MAGTTRSSASATISRCDSPAACSRCDLIEHEQRWLPELADRLPVAVPTPMRNGRPAPELGYDVPWSIVPWLPGRVATGLPAAQRDAAARALAGFVAALATPARPTRR